MSDLWRQITSFTERHLGISAETVEKLAWTLIALVLFFTIRRLAVWLTTRRIRDPNRKYVTSKAIRYLLGFVLLMGLIRIWAGGLAGFATYLGIVSAGLAIALQDPLANLAGWLFIVVRRPFVTGDRIQIGTHAGDVIDVSLFHFSLVEIGNWVDADQSTGRVIHVPNGWVFKHTTCNYSQEFNFIWNEIPVIITFESNWQKAKEILSRIASEHSAVGTEQAASEIRRAAKRFLIVYQHLTPIVWTSVAANGVTLTMRYLCRPRNRRSSAAAIWESVLREFDNCPDIELAYPTTRLYRSSEESKPALRPAEAAGLPSGVDPNDPDRNSGSH